MKKAGKKGDASVSARGFQILCDAPKMTRVVHLVSFFILNLLGMGSSEFELGLLIYVRKLIYRKSLSNLFWSIDQHIICN